MKISAHEEYGLRCLLQIAKQESPKGLTIPEISEAEHISIAYTAKLLAILRRTGFVKSARGKDGGYSLARTSDRIVVAEVMAALGGRVFEAEFCKKHPGQGMSCVHSTDCSIRSLWQRLQGAVDEVLNGTTLQDLVRSEQTSGALFTFPNRVSAPAVAKYPEPLSSPSSVTFARRFASQLGKEFTWRNVKSAVTNMTKHSMSSRRAKSTLSTVSSAQFTH